MEGKNNKNFLDSAELVKEFINFVTHPFTRALFLALQKNPQLIENLTYEEILSLIIDEINGNKIDISFQEKCRLIKEHQDALKIVLCGLEAFKKNLVDVIKYYNEYSGTYTPLLGEEDVNIEDQIDCSQTSINSDQNILSEFENQKHATDLNSHIYSVFFNFDLPHSLRSDSLVVGDFTPLPLSFFSEKLPSLENYQKKRNLINYFSRYLSFLPSQIENFSFLFDAKSFQHKIITDFSRLETRKKNFLVNTLLREYQNNSLILSSKLNELNVKNYVILPKQILEGLIESYQKTSLLDNNMSDVLYYFSGISHENTFYVPFQVFGSLYDLENDVQQELMSFFAMHEYILKKGFLLSESLKKEHEEHRKKLLPKLLPYVQNILSQESFSIEDLFTDVSNDSLIKRKNYSKTHINNNYGIALPIPLKGIDSELKYLVFQKLMNVFSLKELELEKWQKSKELPKWFDVGYIFRDFSTIKKIYGIKDGNQKCFDCFDVSGAFENPGFVFPVIIYHGTTFVFSDFEEFNKILYPFQENSFSKEENKTSLWDLLGNSISNMIHYSKNIYDKDILERTPGSKKREFRENYDFYQKYKTKNSGPEKI